jgi:WS/DGAT/MGAT family acyltransferase
MKQLTGQDASFLYLESRGAHLHLTALYVYEQPGAPHAPLRFADIARHLESRLESSGLFRQKLVRPLLDLDYPYWTDDPDFDLARHLHRYTGAAPRNRQSLFKLMGKFHARPLDLSHPPWEMHVLERLGPLEGLPEHCFAIIARYHHAAIDGASGSQVVDRLHDEQPTEIPAAPATGEPWRAAPGPGVIDMLSRGVLNNLGAPVALLKTMAGAAPGMLLSRLTPSCEDDRESTEAPRTCFNAPVSSGRVFHSVSVDLDKIRAMRQAAPGATVNDVILSICGGALRSWLDAYGELPSRSLVAMVPVNARTSDQSALGGNRLGTLFVPIHTDIADPVERLRAVQQATSRAKTARGGMSAQQISELTSHIPAVTLSSVGHLVTRLGVGHRAKPIANCTITNVPGPRGTLYLGPARLVWSTGTAPIIDGMGLIISAFSYEGQITFSFCSCPEMVPDARFMGDCALEAFEALYDAIR